MLGNTDVFYFLQKPESKKEKAAVSTVSKFQQEPGYLSDAELLAAAGNIMLKQKSNHLCIMQYLYIVLQTFTSYTHHITSYYNTCTVYVH